LVNNPGKEDLRCKRFQKLANSPIVRKRREILMVTFAAAKIERLTGELRKAAKVGVKIRLVLEFEEASEGQLSYDT
jgi:cardiolipin synthase A/B